MRCAVWAYPWDLIDEGPAQACERLAALGIDEINLATNYHSVEAFLPHNPERRVFFTRASSYFQPQDAYGRLEPVPNETMGEADWVDRIAPAVAESPLGLTSWTVGCHNSRLGMRHRDLTIESPYGDRLVFGLCPSQPAVREYLRTLVTELAGRWPFDRIELETADYFYGTGFGWHHDKFHLRTDTLFEFLFGLCFCEACQAHAADAGIDTDRARAACVDALDALVAGEVAPAETDPKAWVEAHPAVDAYVSARTDRLTALYEELAAASEPADLGYYFGFLGVEDSWMHGMDFDTFPEPLDAVTVVAYESSADAVLERYRTAKRLLPDTPVHVGVLPGEPAVSDRETLVEIVTGLADAGAPRVSFYNYGLLPDRNLEWVGDAIAAAD